MGVRETALAFHDAALQGNWGVSVTYRRGSDKVSLTKAVIGQTPIDSELSNGIMQSWQTRDFLIAAADLLLSTEEVLPAVGDRIEHTLGSKLLIYEVQNADDGRCFRYCDEATRATLRIHTRQIASRPA